MTQPDPHKSAFSTWPVLSSSYTCISLALVGGGESVLGGSTSSDGWAVSGIVICSMTNGTFSGVEGASGEGSVSVGSSGANGSGSSSSSTPAPQSPSKFCSSSAGFPISNGNPRSSSSFSDSSLLFFFRNKPLILFEALFPPGLNIPFTFFPALDAVFLAFLILSPTDDATLTTLSSSSSSSTAVVASAAAAALIAFFCFFKYFWTRRSVNFQLGLSDCRALKVFLFEAGTTLSLSNAAIASFSSSEFGVYSGLGAVSRETIA
mmetsp:Transcript_30089/g.46131  ORF Transcript_30089/g.46131 Transcript_30089/m.46131 type:complete len:263 (+) Transcript_30089:954-1742(+)